MESIAAKMPSWIRWPLVPVTSAVAMVVVWVLANLVSKILHFFDGGRGWGENFSQYLLIPGFSTYCSIVAGTLMAPKFRQSTSLTLSIVWIFLAGIWTFFIFFSNTWASLIAVASISVGCAIAAHSSFNDPVYVDELTNTLPTTSESEKSS